MSIVHSADGTAIAFTRVGSGPPVILVDGALCHRASNGGGPLAAQLADRFTVYTYDRRGRGSSGDTAPYAVEREVEDLCALIAHAGGAAAVYGISSGAALALEAARHGAPITALALYEAPFIVDDSREPVGPDALPAIRAAVAEDRRGDAVRQFLRLVGLPRVMVSLMRFMPAWRALKAVAHTLPYDLAIVGGNQVGEPLEAERYAAVTVPALAIAGARSPQWMRNAMRAVADGLPGARYVELEGQTHMVSPKALAPVIAELAGAEAVSATAA
jgi:pimeloyl-ACP methyl ester carboxylesterase